MNGLTIVIVFYIIPLMIWIGISIGLKIKRHEDKQAIEVILVGASPILNILMLIGLVAVAIVETYKNKQEEKRKNKLYAITHYRN